MSTDPTLNHLLDLIGRLTKERDVLEAEYRDRLAAKAAEVDAVQKTIELMSRGDEPRPEQVRPVNFRGARNHDERLMRIANVGDGTVNATKAANMMLIAGVAKGRKRNLVSALYRVMLESLAWQKVSPGTFRHIEAQKTSHNGQGHIDALPDRNVVS